MSFILKSDAFVNGAIAGKYGKESSDVQEGIPQLSFPISWEGAPEGTKSYALVFIDYDNVIRRGLYLAPLAGSKYPGIRKRTG